MTLFCLFAGTILAFAGVLVFRRLASGVPALLDIPNERSSHDRPVVRGAGIAVVFAVLIVYLSAFPADAINWPFVFCGLFVATVSFLDDLFSIPLFPRLIVHFTSASILVYFCGPFESLSVPGVDIPIRFGAAAPILTVLFIVWTTNAFNFMDGIDGIAGVQAAVAGLGWMLFGMAAGLQTISMLGAVICGASIGFLFHNWQPARVFMGDVGSTFLGFSFGAFPLIVSNNVKMWGGDMAFAAVVFLWLFLFDTIFTRIRQVAALKPFWRAHRDHLYQRIVISGASHAKVAVFFGIAGLLLAGSLSAYYAFRGSYGVLMLILIAASPSSLLIWSWKKRLT